MREQLIQYVKLLFAATPDSEDMQQEILQNTLDRYDDLIEQGKQPEAAYRLAIAGIGDVNELLGSPTHASADNEAVDYRGRRLPSSKKKTMRAVAIGLYICCVVPVIALGNVANGIIGVCLMLLLVAVATVLIILSSSGKQDGAQAEGTGQPNHPGYRAYKSLSGAVTLAVYLLVSFWSQAWHITWLIFPISAAIDGIVKAVFDLKEAKKYEA
ncbi:MAG: hypothetical protein IKY59_04875 [Oscillospiraceae bacterium]|nr:hypothetical protein [Oscillospiraceae bacterium]